MTSRLLPLLQVRSIRRCLAGFLLLVVTSPLQPNAVCDSIETRPGLIDEPQDGGAARSLEPSTPVEAELSAGQTHVYQLRLRVGQYLRVAVDQKEVDVTATLFGPNNAKLAEVNTRHAFQGQKAIFALIEQSGNHRLDVTRASRNGAPGRYTVKIEELREATTRDKALVAARRSISEGVRLLEDTRAEALQESLHKFEEAILLSRQAADPNAEGDALVDKAEVFYRLSNHGNSLNSYNQALSLYRSGNNWTGEAAALNGMGLAYAELGDYQKSIEFRNQALRLSRAKGDRDGEASALAGIGYIYFLANDYKEKAFDALNQSLTIYRALGKRAREADATHLIGLVHYSQDEYAKALEYYNQALALYRADGSRRGEASVIFSTALAYFQKGDHQQALDLYQKALSIQRATRNRRDEGNVLGGIGQVYRILGEHQKALDYFDQALSIFRITGNRHNESTQLYYKAQVYISMGEFHKARVLFTESLEICRLTGNRVCEANGTNGVGLAHAGLHQYEKALEFYDRALAIFREFGNHRFEADSLSHIGRTHLLLGKHQKALAYLNDALAIYRTVRVPRGEAQTLYSIARAHRALGDFAEARSRSEAAIRIAETFRREVANQHLRTSYLATVRDYYELNIDLLMQLHRRRPLDGLDAVAFETSERARARSMLDLLAEMQIDIRQGVEPALLERERSLRQLISAQAERQTQLLSTKTPPEQLAKISREIEAALAEHQDVKAKIRVTSPGYAALTQPQPLSLKQIQAQVLDSDTLLLEYVLGEERSYLWAITQTSISGYGLPGRAEIEAAARSFYELAKDKTKRQELEQSAARLSQVLLAPALEQLDKRRLAIVADGALQYVPFAALPDPSVVRSQLSIAKNNGPRTTDHGQPLIVNHEIVSLPSASTLGLLRRATQGRAIAPKLVAVLADPVFALDDVRVKRTSTDASGSKKQLNSSTKDSGLLQSVEDTGLADGRWPLPRLLGTRREARTILSLAPAQRSMRALDFEASRDTAVAGDLSQYQIVHFATHGMINSRHPELSGLVLSLVDRQGRAQNGFLRLNEIYNLRLPAELVVLSACQTGLGKEIRGEGIVGLTRGFMYAGAPRLVISLWQVDDKATSEFMGHFYRGMFTRKLSAAAALREAQIEMWKGKDWPSPYYWAAFALQGEWK